jgi:hypothetical protein
MKCKRVIERFGRFNGYQNKNGSFFVLRVSIHTLHVDAPEEVSRSVNFSALSFPTALSLTSFLHCQRTFSQLRSIFWKIGEPNVIRKEPVFDTFAAFIIFLFQTKAPTFGSGIYPSLVRISP